MHIPENDTRHLQRLLLRPLQLLAPPMLHTAPGCHFRRGTQYLNLVTRSRPQGASA